MNKALVNKRIDELFIVKSGDYHALAELDPGNIPLIACGETNNGAVGYFSIPNDKVYNRSITVAYNGRPLTSKFHPYKFGAKDDVAVLIPRITAQDKTMVYIAALLNRLKWQYSYSRKCYREKLCNLMLSIPLKKINGIDWIDEQAIDNLFPRDIRSYIPNKLNVKPVNVPDICWRIINILDIFKLKRGDYHSIADLDPGSYMTVSIVSVNNGIVGYFGHPKSCEVYERGKITISTVGGDAFVQLDDFIVTDNVIVCIPKRKLRISTLFFLAFMINQEKWRFSYGRQCYIQKLSRMNIYVPVNENDELNEDLMQRIVENTPYWHKIVKRFKKESYENNFPISFNKQT